MNAETFERVVERPYERVASGAAVMLPALELGRRHGPSSL
jgi:hypothetical protein